MSVRTTPTKINMNTVRLESFSDAVLAVIITIMVLELHTPSSPSITALSAGLPTFVAYAISFSIIGTYWNNHHHLIRQTQEVRPSIMWANLFFLFWVSLIPFMTSWMGEFYTDTWPTACYALLLTICGLSYNILQYTVTRTDDSMHFLSLVNYKGVVSVVGYITAIGFSFVNHWISDVIFVVVAIIWFIPKSEVRVARSVHD